MSTNFPSNPVLDLLKSENLNETSLEKAKEEKFLSDKVEERTGRSMYAQSGLYLSLIHI